MRRRRIRRRDAKSFLQWAVLQVVPMAVVLAMATTMMVIAGALTAITQESGQAMDSIMFSNRSGKVVSPTGYYWSGWVTDAAYAAACRCVTCC